MSWRERLPDGMKITQQDAEGFKIELGLPVGPDGMFPQQCPEVEAHQFGIPTELAAGGEGPEELSCPYCGHRAAAEAFLTADEHRRLRSAAEAAGLAYVEDAMDKMLRGLERSMGGSQHVRVTLGPRRARRTPPLHEYEVPEARRTMTHTGCGLTYAVYGLAVYCPRCGETAPHDEFAELIEVQRRSLAMFDELPEERRADYEAAGVITRAYETTVKDAFGTLETLLRDEFVDRVSGAPALLKGRGNVFQRLADADELYRVHLGVSLATSAGEAWATAAEGVALRHILVHNNGVIDEKYVAAVPGAAERLGRRVHVSRETAEQVLAAATKVAAAATSPPRST